MVSQGHSVLCLGPQKFVYVIVTNDSFTVIANSEKIGTPGAIFHQNVHLYSFISNRQTAARQHPMNKIK